MEESLNPIKQVVEFMSRMRLWQMHLDRFGMDKNWCDSIRKMEIRIRTDHFLAIHGEIMEISFQNGKGTERAIQYIKNTSEEIRDGIFNFQDSNPTLNGALGLDQSNLQTYYKGLSRTEKRQYDAFAKMSRMFFDFLEDVGEIIEIEPFHKETKSTTVTYEHPHIFVDRQAWLIFENLHEQFSKVKNLLAYYSFIYRMMLKDHLIHSTVKDAAFRLWLFETKGIDIPKTKTLDKCTTADKSRIYQQAKELISKPATIREQ